ncbi:MAG: type II secretion system protein M [Aquamicrobium sp.]|nr:type II secretion system protein M [Aquamicrobium sp.]
MSRTAGSWVDRRFLSLAVVAIFLCAAVVVIVDAVSTVRAQRGAVVELRQRTRLLEARAAELAGGSQDAAGGSISRNRLIAGDTSGLASAEFQRDFTRLVEDAGALVRSLDIRESERVEGVSTEMDGELMRLHLEASVEVLEQTLPDLLYALETTLPLMVVDAVTLRPNRSAGGAFDAAADTGSDRALNLQLGVSAFWIREL